EGWDRNINDSTFCMVNPDYYHMISRTNGASAADVTIWFDDLLDNVYQEMAHWQTVPRWENMGVVTTVMNPSPILSSATSSGWGNYSFPPFILGSPAPPLALTVASTSICSTDTLTFNATPGFTNYEFFNNSVSIQNGTSDTLILTGLSSGDTIEVTGTDVNCNAYSNKLVITVTTQPVAAIAGTDTICEGTSTALTASGGTTFLWNTTEITASIVVSPIADSSYTVIVSNGACADTATFNVTVNPLPIANITGGGVTICDGIAVNLNGDPGDSYLWTPTAEITQNIVVSPSVTTTYTLTVTNSCGTDIATTDITVLTAAQAGPDFELCKNLDPLGYLDTAAAFPAGGTWSSPDPLVDPNLNPDGFIDHISIPWGNGYQIVYTAGGCTDTMLLDVTGAKTGNDTVICPSGAFFLSVAQPPGGTWSYLDPTTGIQTTTNIIDPITGEIDKGDLSGDITFVYTSQGCPDTMVVTLCGENDIWVPNVFSPNGDFWNDIVRVRGEAVDYVTIVIYDRWGELIFDGNSTEAAMNTGWDGTKKGKELAPQVFVYYLKGAFLDGEEFVKQGNITLVK
ncbi:MAG TPA: gliding motility-associated C-terminal domain-containing protein, partial [Flavobacteriales bacterium]|nr:gliding motility-associated C-terminal domain-containing protein [Flavobacteriales bacterium]